MRHADIRLLPIRERAMLSGRAMRSGKAAPTQKEPPAALVFSLTVAGALCLWAFGIFLFTL
jgi:hypothetical protein